MQQFQIKINTGEIITIIGTVRHFFTILRLLKEDGHEPEVIEKNQWKAA